MEGINNDVSLEVLTDEAILDYTKIDGVDMILTNHKDFNIAFNSPRTVDGGVYDAFIFGAPLIDRCICGHIGKQTNQPCPYCGAKVLTEKEGLRRFARIELGFKYLNELRFEVFKGLFNDVFGSKSIVFKMVNGRDLKSGGYSERGNKNLSIKVFDSCQFNYYPEKDTLEITELIDDESKCSYDGILKILEEHFPERYRDFRNLINEYYIVLPARMRPYTISRSSNADRKKSLVPDVITSWYSVVIAFCSKVDRAEDANEVSYPVAIKKFKTAGERVRYTAMLRAFLNAGKKRATQLLNSSKENLARNLYNVRTKNSARCPIVPDTTHAVDELVVPRHLAYEMCREGFIEYLIKELNFTRKEAQESTRLEALNEETQRLFTEYAEKQIVLGIN